MCKKSRSANWSQKLSIFARFIFFVASRGYAKKTLYFPTFPQFYFPPLCTERNSVLTQKDGVLSAIFVIPTSAHSRQHTLLYCDLWRLWGFFTLRNTCKQILVLLLVELPPPPPLCNKWTESKKKDKKVNQHFCVFFVVFFSPKPHFLPRTHPCYEYLWLLFFYMCGSMCHKHTHRQYEALTPHSLYHDW